MPFLSGWGARHAGSFSGGHNGSVTSMAAIAIVGVVLPLGRHNSEWWLYHRPQCVCRRRQSMVSCTISVVAGLGKGDVGILRRSWFGESAVVAC